MSGRGDVRLLDGVKSFIPSDNVDDDKRIFRYSADGKWQIAQEPLHGDIDTRCPLPALLRACARWKSLNATCGLVVDMNAAQGPAHMYLHLHNRVRSQLRDVDAGKLLGLDQGWPLPDSCLRNKLWAA
jgi:hypothetical protein